MVSINLEERLRGGVVRQLQDGVDRNWVGSEPGVSAYGAGSFKPLYFHARTVRFAPRTQRALNWTSRRPQVS